MRTVICFGEDWGRHPSTLQFLAKELAKRYRVLWIESIGMRRPRFSAADFRRAWEKFRNWWQAHEKKDSGVPNLVVVAPLVLPFHGNAIARAINRIIMRRAVRKLLPQDGNQRPPVIVTASPSSEYLLDQIVSERTVYYCADEYSCMPGMDAGLIRNLEARLLSKVDAVIVTSETLLKAKSAAGKPISLLRHGVDTVHFSAAARPETPVASVLQGIPAPIFGFYGLVQSHIDFETIVTVAQRRRDWSFVFIGKRDEDPSTVPSLPNIHYLPAQPYAQLPSVLKGFNVCLIPYQVDQRTRDRNPVKLREYLAGGKPVISTSLPEVLVYRDVVAIAGTADEFERAAERLLQEQGEEEARQRMEYVRHDNWDAVAHRFVKVLEG
jgi:glycosyltransferase involved in cell wall biosynthesis